MGFVRRNYGTLFFLALIIGLATGAVMAQRGIQIDLGTVAGHKLALAQPTPKPATSLTGTAQAGTATGGQTNNPARSTGSTPAGGQTNTTTTGEQAFTRPTTGTVQKVEGSTITVATQDGAVVKATVSSSTTYIKSMTITLADIKAGDTVTAVGQAASDGSITAQQVTVGTSGQFAAAGGFGRQGGTPGGQPGTGGAGRQGTGQLASFTVVTGTVQSISDNSLTVQQPNGQTTKLVIASNARLQKSVSASLADITVGAQIAIIGQTGSDGSIAATTIQIASPS